MLNNREKKKFLRTESKYYKEENNPNPFLRKQVDDKVLINFLVEMMVKSSNLLALVNTGPDNHEELKILEMSLNKEGILSKFFMR